ncbi:MAG: hypothetical protein Q7R72_01150 [bacterium]|nr:hypothetical protein [bacterium]
MAELHESVLVNCRNKFVKKGWHEHKTPIHGYRPDLFIQRFSKEDRVIEEIILEAEIQSTLHTDHTAEQLGYIHEYIVRQTKKKIIVKGFLAIPKGKKVLTIAEMFLYSQFPGDDTIKIIQI